MNETQTMPPKLAAALVKAQKAAKAVPRDTATKSGPQYRYASAESVIDEGRVALSSAGLAMLCTLATLVERVASVGDVAWMMQATYQLVHESGETWTFTRDWPVLERKGTGTDKMYGGALTTCLAYALRDVLLLPRDDDAAAMDRRDDSEPEPRREEPRREAPREEPRREAPRDDAPREQPAEGKRAASPHEVYNAIFDDIVEGRGIPTIPSQIAGAPLLTPEARSSLSYLAEAYCADNQAQIGRIAATVRGDKSLSKAWVDVTCERMVEAFERASARSAA